MVGPGGHNTTIDYYRRVHVGYTTHFSGETTLDNRGNCSAFDDASLSENLNPVTN